MEEVLLVSNLHSGTSTGTILLHVLCKHAGDEPLQPASSLIVVPLNLTGWNVRIEQNICLGNDKREQDSYEIIEMM